MDGLLPAQDAGKAADGTDDLGMGLFRREAIEAQQTQRLGTVLLAPSVSASLFSAFAALCAFGIGALLAFGDYTRKESVTGWLVPQLGMARVVALQQSVVAELKVANGDEVEAGAELVVLSTELRSQAMGATQEGVIEELVVRIESLVAERDLTERLYRHGMDAMRKRKENLARDIELRGPELDLQRERLDAASAAYERVAPLAKTGSVRQERIENLQNDRYEQTARLQEMERELTRAQLDYDTLVADIAARPIENAMRLAQIDRDIAVLRQERAEAEARREIVIVAPKAGTVAGLQVSPGDTVDPSGPILSLLPRGSQLEAEIFVPSRARGFIEPGQRVLLRYRAFPFQKFGQYEGKVVDVSRAAVMPADLPSNLSGLVGGAEASEPIYLVKVGLAEQDVTAYGNTVALRPGMKLDAYIEIETRKIYEWFLEPLYTITG